MTKQVFIVEYKEYDNMLEMWTHTTSGYFDSKEDAETYLNFHGYEWNERNNEYTHSILKDYAKIKELEKVNMNLTLPEIDTFLYEQFGAKVNVEYIGSLAQITVSGFNVGDIRVNESKFIHSYSSKEFFEIEKVLLIANTIKERVNPPLGNFTTELFFEKEYDDENTHQWTIVFYDKDGCEITHFDTKYYSDDNIDEFVSAIETYLRLYL